MLPLKPAQEFALYVLIMLLAMVALLTLRHTEPYLSMALSSSAVAAMGLSLLRCIALYQREHRARKAAEGMLNKLSHTVEQSPIGILIADRERRIEYVNTRYCTLLGQPRQRLIGQELNTLHLEDLATQQLEEICHQLVEGKTWRCEARLLGNNQQSRHVLTTVSPIRDATGAHTHMLVQHEDISYRVAYREHLFQQTNFDPLTTLPNRALAMDRLVQATNNAERHHCTLTLMLLDLDRFKLINDSLGHLQGDRVLVDIAERIRQCVREEDTVARIGADEFLVIMVNRQRRDDSSGIAHKIVERLSKPLMLDSREVTVTASIGLTVYPADGTTATELLRNAETALVMAKQQGLNTFRFYTPDMNRLATERLALESQLHHAITRQELSLHYQPILDLGSGRAVAVEALMRWNSAELGSVPPDRFIPIAEETGLIIPLGQWLLQEACRQAAQWRHQGRTLRVAVNISSRQFVGGHIVDAVRQALAANQLPAELLELELTEGLLLDDAPQTKHALHQLKRLGVRLVLDDFGTGYSSLSYLKRYPFDALKIDRSFIRDLGQQPETAALTQAIITIGHSLGLEVIGEGIETVAQAVFLQRHGCRLAQGFLLGRPQPPAELEEQLDHQVPGPVITQVDM